jgi:hypothetical protein
MYISGTYDTRWDNGVLNPAFSALKASDFEVVQRGWAPSVSLVVTLPGVMGANTPANVTVTAYDSTYHLATGYRGSIHFTSTDGSASLPLDYAFTSGDSGTHTFASGITLRTAGAQTVTATDLADGTINGSQSVMVGPATPTGLMATAVTTTQVNLSWNASPGATQYEIVRASAGSGYTTLTTTAGMSTTDMTVSAGTTYLYEVRAIDSSARTSPFSAPEAATTILFTDDPLVAHTTVVKAIHISELRQAVNAMRAAAALGAVTFTDSSLSALPIRAVHLQELRNGLSQARAALGLSAVAFTDSTPGNGVTVVKAVHVQELRNAVK